MNILVVKESAVASEYGSDAHSEAALQRILIVDDEPDMRLYMKRCLGAIRPGAYVVLEAANGEEGLNLVRKDAVDVVVSDVVMPRLDGIGLCRALHVDERLRHIPVLLVTGDMSQEAAAAEAARGVLRKPFNAAEFARALERVLTRPPPE